MKKRCCYYIPADAFIEGHGYRVSVVFEGEAGHSPTGTWPYTGAHGEKLPWFWGQTRTEAEEIAQRENSRMGLSAADVGDIVTSSVVAQVRS